MKIMKMKMYAIVEKAKPDTENIRGLKLAVDLRTLRTLLPRIIIILMFLVIISVRG
jgi:hypothetical protein